MIYHCRNRFMKEVKFLDKHKEFAFVSTYMSFFDDTGFGENGRLLKHQREWTFLSKVLVFAMRLA